MKEICRAFCDEIRIKEVPIGLAIRAFPTPMESEWGSRFLF
jgi:hypothetical protein